MLDHSCQVQRHNHVERGLDLYETPSVASMNRQRHIDMILHLIEVEGFAPPTAPAVGATQARRESESEMVDMSKYMGSRFLKVADVKEGGTFQAKIVAVEISEKFDKPEANLDDGSVLSLNATNVGRLVRAYGANSNDWIGKAIELSVGEVEYQDKPVETILVKAVSPPVENKAPVKPKRDFNDAVPF